MLKIALVNPLSSAHSEFGDYFASSFERIGAQVSRIGSMQNRRSSPNAISIVIELLTRPDRFERLGLTISRQPKVYLFADPFLVIDVLFSLITKSPIVLYVHERKVFGRSLSSKIKGFFYRFVLARCIRIGPKEENRVNLLFGCPLMKKPNKENMVLCFGNWINGKVSNSVQRELQELRNKGLRLVRLGITHDKTLLDAFDETVDRFIQEEEKRSAFRRAKYLYLPYTPTNQSGVIVDCLNYHVRVLLGESSLPEEYVLYDISMRIDEIGHEQRFDFQGAYKKLDRDNLKTLSHIGKDIEQAINSAAGV